MKKISKGANLAAPQELKEMPWTKDHGREMFERTKSCRLIKYDELLINWPDFAEKIKSISRYGNVDSVILIGITSEPRYYHVYFYTSENEYSITAKPGEFKDSYLGCVVNSRKPRPGETWTRGNDLPDGKYSNETWNDIVERIISYEMKTLQL